jgi:hypothetical protein
MSRAANGRSSIHRRTDGQGWEGWVSLGLHPVTGKRWRKHVRGKTKTEVARKIAQLERQRDRGVPAVDPETTISSWLEAWLAGRVTAGLRPNSISAYRTDIKYVTRSGVGRVRLRDLTPTHVEQVYAYVIALPRASTGSAAHLRRTLNAALNVAVQSGHLPVATCRVSCRRRGNRRHVLVRPSAWSSTSAASASSSLISSRRRLVLSNSGW